MSPETREPNASDPSDPSVSSAESSAEVIPPVSNPSAATESSAGSEATMTPPPARPRPAYGEYAPEGWSWTPPVEASSQQASRAVDGELAAPATTGRPQPGQVTGVPHNLGARGAQQSAPVSHATTDSPIEKASQAHSASDAPMQNAPSHYKAAAPIGAPLPAKRGSADRVISILLLVIGGFGALNMALSLITLPETLNILASAAELKDFVTPAALGTLATVGAISILAIYAVNLILTIQRLRARKLAFWVPLVAAVLAFIASMIIMFVGVNMAPELIAFMSDPDSVSIIMEKLNAPVS